MLGLWSGGGVLLGGVHEREDGVVRREDDADGLDRGTGGDEQSEAEMQRRSEDEKAKEERRVT